MNTTKRDTLYAIGLVFLIWVSVSFLSIGFCAVKTDDRSVCMDNLMGQTVIAIINIFHN